MRNNLRKYIERAANWTIGFLITGEITHGLDWEDYREAGRKAILLRLSGFILICSAIIYILSLPQFLFLFIGALSIGIGLGVFLIVAQWSAVKILTRNR